MAEERVCSCGFDRWAALAGYGRLLLASATLLAAVAAARGLFAPEYEFATTAALWALPAFMVAADITALWANGWLEYCTGRPHWTATGRWHWLFLLTVFVAAASLFPAEQPILAIVLEIYIVGRVMVKVSLVSDDAVSNTEDDCTNLDPDATREFMQVVIRYAAFGIVAILCATTWMATGTAPAWAESMITATLWIGASALLFGEAAMIWSDMVHDYLAPQQDDSRPSFMEEPQRELDDIPVISVGRAGWWLANGGLFLLVYELSLAGQTVLASLFVLLLLMAWAVNTERKLRAPANRRGEIGMPYLAIHAAVRDIARTLHLAIATPVRAVRRMLGRKA